MQYKIVSRTLTIAGEETVQYLRIELANEIEPENPICIPFALANRDCAQFVADWQAGADVVDAEGEPVPFSGETLAAMGLVPAEEPPTE